MTKKQKGTPKSRGGRNVFHDFSAEFRQLSPKSLDNTEVSKFYHKLNEKDKKAYKEGKVTIDDLRKKYKEFDEFLLHKKVEKLDYNKCSPKDSKKDVKPDQKDELSFFEKYEDCLKGIDLEKDVHEKKRIGGGGFAEVFEVRISKINPLMKFAMKEIDISKIGNEYILNEIKIMKNAYGTNLVNILGCRKTKKKVHILMYKYDMTLEKYIKDFISLNKVSFKTKIQILLHIACGLKSLHEQNIMHRDLKQANILVNGNENVIEQVHISDFGISKPTKGIYQNENHTVVGTRKYMPKEALSGNYSGKSDIYQFGLIMKAVLFGDMGVEMNEKEMTKLFKTKQILPRTNLFQMIQDCLNEEPNERTNIEDLVENLSETLFGDVSDDEETGSFFYKKESK